MTPQTSVQDRPEDPAGPAARALDQPTPHTPGGSPQPVRFVVPGVLASLLSALALAMHEVSNVSAGFVTRGGEHTSPGMLGSPLAIRERTHWNDRLEGAPVGGLEPEQVWSRMVLAFQVLDVVFVVVYAVALLGLVRVGRKRLGTTPRGPAATLPALGTVAGVGWLVVALAGVDLAESVSHGVLAVVRCPEGDCVPAWGAWLGAGLSTAKWVLVVALAVVGVVAGWRARGRLGEVGAAVWAQRFSLLAFLPIAALGVLPLGRVVSNLFDQIPDVQRAWLDSWSGAWHMFAGAIAFGFAVLLPIFFLGRVRADWAVRREVGADWWPYYTGADKLTPRRLDAWFWFGGPTLVLVVAGIAELTGGEIFGVRLLVFCLLPVVIGGLSLRIRRTDDKLETSRLKPPDLEKPHEGYGRDVMAVGDIITVAAAVLSGLGLVRAFTGPAVLDRWGLLDVDGLAAVALYASLLMGLGIVVLAWPVAQGLLDRVASPDLPATTTMALPARVEEARNEGLRVLVPGLDLPPGPDGENPRDVFRLGLLGLATVGFLVLCAVPWFFDWLGVLGSATAATGALTLMLGAAVAYAQDRQPPELFQKLHLPLDSTPVIGLFVLTVLLTSLVGGRTDVHPVANPAGSEIPARPTLQDAFTAWLGASAACTVPLAGQAGFTVRPMVMYAAEGGGIRAAYWASSALDRIGHAGGSAGCGTHAGLFSAGASGGAVGLTVARFAESPRRVAEAMAGPDPLSAAATGLLASDLLASVTGIRFNAPADHRGGSQALDRAGLMEIAWEETPGLDELRTTYLPADGNDTIPGSVTGHLVLTTSVAWDGCRALLSQVDLSADATSDDGWPVCGGGAAGQHSFDLLHLYGRGTGAAGDGPTGGEEQCLGNPQALTAALLASRFPYVTPSGVVGPCRGLQPLQLIDGGYTDNTGLGTIVSLAPLWGDLVRDHNDSVLAAGEGELILPMVAYLENGTGGDYTVVSPEAADVSEGQVERAQDDALQDAHDVPGDRADGVRRLRWPRGVAIPESLIPPIGVLTGGGDSKVKTALGLAQAQVVVRDALCTRDAPETADACRALRSSGQSRISVYVVHQTPQPSMSAPLGWVLSDASQSEMDADLCLQEGNTSEDLPEDPASRQGYGTLRDLLLAMGLPADSTCRVR